MITHTVVLAKRLIRANLKMPIFLILSLTQPILYLIFFGQLFGKIPALSSGGSASYMVFLAPGMAILAAMFGSVYSGMGTLSDVERGMFDRILASPASRPSIPLSYLVSTSVLVLVQASILLIVAALMGALPSTGLIGVMSVLAICVLVGVAFGAVSNTLAFFVGKADAIMPLLNFVALPMMFISNIMISWDLMPGWIANVARLNPLSWATTLARSAYVGVWDERSVFFFWLLVVFTIVSVGLMLISFKRFVKRR